MTIIDTHSCTVPGLGVGAFHKHQVVHAGPLVCHVGVPITVFFPCSSRFCLLKRARRSSSCTPTSGPSPAHDQP